MNIKEILLELVHMMPFTPVTDNINVISTGIRILQYLDFGLVYRQVDTCRLGVRNHSRTSHGSREYAPLISGRTTSRCPMKI